MSKIYKILVLSLACCHLNARTAQAIGKTAEKSVVDSNVRIVVTDQSDPTAEESDDQEFNPAECFDKVWRTINEHFWDPNFNGVDWQDARRRYTSRALAAKDHESFAAIVNQMLSELRTSHTRYYTKWDPDYYTLQAVFLSMTLTDLSGVETPILERYLSDLHSSQAYPHRSGIGVVTKEIEGCHYVTAVLISSPAEKAGIVLGDRLIEVNGRPFHPIRSFENMAGQKLEMTIQRGPSPSTRRMLKVTPLDMKEKDLFENDSSARLRCIEYKGHRFAYIRLWWLSGLVMRQTFESGLNMAHASEGVIIDLRDGFGGGPYIEYIDPFLRCGLEEIIGEQMERTRRLESKVGYSGPAVVLINGGSRSGKELLAYCFKKTGKGVLLGERTAGYVTGGRKKRICQDSLLYYGAARISFDGKSLEGVGVEPDIIVPFDVRFAAGRDAQLERAKQQIVELIESGH